MRPSASTLLPPNPANDQVDQIEDEKLLLAGDQVELIDTFRRDVRLCETDAEKFRLCAEVRSQLLSRHTEVVLLIALFDRVMLAECRGYRDYKTRDRNLEKEQSNVEEWDRFIGVATTGFDIINKCLPHLKAVSVRWGREKLQYYNWPGKGWKFCKTLGAAANKMGWAEFVIKANQLLRRRVHMDGKLRRHRIGVSRDPLKPVELQNIVKWTDEEPFVKDKDPEKVSLPFKKLSIQDLPPGYTFDRYGLMVRTSSEPFGTTKMANESALEWNGNNAIRHQELVRLVPALNTNGNNASYPARSNFDTRPQSLVRSEHSTPSRVLEEYYLPETLPPLFGDDSGSGASTWADAPLPGWNDIDEGQADSGVHTETMPSTLALGTMADEENDTNSQDSRAVAATSRLRPRQVNPYPYHETGPTSTNSKQHRRRLLKGVGHLEGKCCPGEVPAELLAFLDEMDSHAFSQTLPKISLCNYPLEDLCLVHLKKLAKSIVGDEKTELLPQSPKASKFVKSGRDSSLKRRRASFSDLQADPVKRLCTEPLDTLGHFSMPAMLHNRCPFPDPLGNERYRHQVLKELTEILLSPGSRGWRTNRTVSMILHNSKRPSSDEAYFLTGDKAAQKVESGVVDAPIFTQGQQHFRWKSTDRPITQLFHYMEDVGLERSVPVQIPSRSSQDDSFECKTLAQVRDRFLTGRSTDDPWNLLDFQSPVPCTLPSFLGGENCQLLLRIRDVCLMGNNGQRIEASGHDWNSWRNVIEWGLLSEGGNNTAPHMDSNGYSTWITVQEGQIGFGWMCSSREKEDEWMSDPFNYVGGKWRYVILSPGDTVFFPSGTIHYVFRKRGTQTFALGGHVLQWSGMERWLEVLIAQMKNPEITNEDIGSAGQKHVQVAKELVRNRIAIGRVHSMGGPDGVARVSMLMKNFGRMSNSDSGLITAWSNELKARTKAVDAGYPSSEAGGTSRTGIYDGGDFGQLHQRRQESASHPAVTNKEQLIRDAGSKFLSLGRDVGEDASTSISKDTTLQKQSLFNDEPVFQLETNHEANLETRILDVLEVSSGRLGRKFLPFDQMDKIFTYEAILKELQATYPSRTAKGLQCLAHQIHDEVELPNSSLTTRRKIFGTLVRINKTACMIHFIDEGLYDSDLPFYFPNSNEQHEPVIRRTRQGHDVPVHCFTVPRWKPFERESFEQYQWEFQAPFFQVTPTHGQRRRPRHYVLGDNAVLPFIEDFEGEGSGDLISAGYSEVWRVRIHPAHHSHPSSENPYFAVKRLKPNNRNIEMFQQEVATLKRLSERDHAHLMRLELSYEYQDRYHLLFRWADGNLRDYWEKHPEPSEIPRTHTFTTWVTQQWLGLAEALMTIHECPPDSGITADDEGDDLAPARTNGRHGDIKPENILWFRPHESNGDQSAFKGRFVISDFGLTEFHRDETGLVSPMNTARSPTYRAPEYDVSETISQSYDIWTLGCVLLEFVVWYMKGYQAFDQFSKDRAAEDNSPIKEDVYFKVVKHAQRTNGAILSAAVFKKAVATQFQSLREQPQISELLVDVLDFIEQKMLRMNPEKRATCKEVVNKFLKIHGKALTDEDYCLQSVPGHPKRVKIDLSLLSPHVFEITPYFPCISVDETIGYQVSQPGPPCTSDLFSVPWRPPEQAQLDTNSSGNLPHRSFHPQLPSKRVHFDEQSAPTAYIDETDAVSGFTSVLSTERQHNAESFQSVSVTSTSDLKHSTENTSGDKLKSQMKIREKLRRLWPRRKD